MFLWGWSLCRRDGFGGRWWFGDFGGELDYGWVEVQGVVLGERVGADAGFF